jgi:uncharacterized lipoprotein YajG
MDLKGLKWLFLAAAVLLQVGCATEKKTYDDTTLDPSTSQEDDSHGWGTSVQSAGH